MNAIAFLVVIVAILAAALIAYRTGRARAKRDAMPVVDSKPRLAATSPHPALPGAASLVSTWTTPSQFDEFAVERNRLFGELADARADTARYRQIIIDLEHDAPPPLLGAPTAPDDLKLIVGVGPVLERMLQQLGVFTYRQIAHWTEHDVETFDAKLAEFPGRIRRDAWVTQARALHQSKYGERP